MLTRYVRNSTAGLPRVFWFLWLGILINRLGTFVSPFLILFLTGQRTFSVEQATQVVALAGLGSFIAQIWGGYFADRFGRRLTMMTSFFVTPVLVMALYNAADYRLIALLTLLMGFFTDLYRPASAAVIVDVVPSEDRVRAYSLRYWAINLGAAVALSLAGFLARENYILLFIGDAVTTFGYGLIVLFFIPETRPPRTAAKADAPRLPRRLYTPEEAPVFFFTVFFAIMTICLAVVAFQSNVTLPLAMIANGLTEADYGVAIALNGVAIVLFMLPLNQYLTRFSRFTVLAIAAVATGVGFGLNAIATTLPFYIFAVVIWTLGEMMANPVATAIIADISPVERRGFYQGIFGASFGMSAFLGPILGGITYQRLGSNTLWGICLLLGIIVAVVQLTIMQQMFNRLRLNA